MNKKSMKTTIIIKIVTVVFLFVANSFAQDAPIKLILNNPLNAEIKGGEKDVYSVSLLADQTALIEVVQDGIDINFEAFDVQGKSFIISLSPSGLYGDDSILVTAKEAGEYKVEVSPASPRSGLGKYTIDLKEIRPTVPEDFQINEASAKILQLAGEATQLRYNGTIEGLRAAIAKWNEAIEVSKIKKDRVWEGIALVSQGLIYEKLGELQNSLDVYLASLDIWRDIKNKQYEGSAVNNIGIIYGDLGEHEKAISYFNQAIEIQRKVGDRISVGIYLNNLAYSHMSLGNYEKAEELYKQSLDIKWEDKRPRGQRSVAVTLNNLGRALVLKGDIEDGKDFLRQALDLRRKIEHHWGIANSLLNLGKFKLEIGEKEESYTLLMEANIKSIAVGDRRLEAESLYLLAIAEKDRGNLKKAIENISKGLDLIEQIRGELVGSQNRYSYFSTVQGYYELYTDLLVSRFEKTKNKDDLALALEISERSRSRSLVELLQEAKVDFKTGIAPALLSEEKNLQKRINDKYASRQTLLGGKPKPEQITKINNEINELNTRIQNVNIRIRRENPKYADLSEGKTLSTKEIQSLLDEETVLLEYKLGEKRSFLWLVTKDSVEIFTLLSRKDIEEKAKSFYDLTVANDKSQDSKILQISKDLSNTLLPSIAKKIANKRLAIVADGILQYIPFSALTNAQSNDLLIETNEIVILPSASVLAQLRANPDRTITNKKTIAIFADPVFDLEDSRIAKNSNDKSINKEVALSGTFRDFKFGETLPRLLASRQEARTISKFTDENKALVRMDFDASIENIENTDLKEYRILHFATHGLLNSTRPELSGLVFSLFDKNGQSKEGFLSLNYIYNLELSSDLIVLSACQTALGKDIRGEGLIGLSRGFLYAGSNRIIASLWKVDDAATSEFMKRFYTNHLQKGMSASKALQQTKLEMKKIPRYSSPYYWSAFTLLGDWK